VLCVVFSFADELLPSFLWFLGGRSRSMWPALRLVLFFVAGLLPYLYLVWASQHPPVYSWGDQSYWNGFWTHFLRKEYGTFRLWSGGVGSTYPQRLQFYFHLLPENFGRVGCLLSLLGALVCAWVSWSGPTSSHKTTPKGRRASAAGSRSPMHSSSARRVATRWLCATLFGFLLLYVGGFMQLTNLPLSDKMPLASSVLQRFFIQPNAVLALFAGMGLALVHQVVVPRLLQTQPSKQRSPQSKRKSDDPASLSTAPALSAPESAFSTGASASSGSASLSSSSSSSGVTTNHWLGIAFAVLVVLVVWAPLAHQQYHFWAHYDRELLTTYAHDLLESMPPNAILLLRGDLSCNGAFYAQVVEGLRPDVTLVPIELLTYRWWLRTQRQHAPNVRFPPGRELYHPRIGYSMLDFLRANRDHSHPEYLGFHRPMLLAKDWKDRDDAHLAHYELRPHSLAWLVVDKELSPSLMDGMALVRPLRVPLSALTTMEAFPFDSWEKQALMRYGESYYWRTFQKYHAAQSLAKKEDLQHADVVRVMELLEEVIAVMEQLTNTGKFINQSNVYEIYLSSLLATANAQPTLEKQSRLARGARRFLAVEKDLETSDEWRSQAKQLLEQFGSLLEDE